MPQVLAEDNRAPNDGATGSPSRPAAPETRSAQLPLPTRAKLGYAAAAVVFALGIALAFLLQQNAVPVLPHSVAVIPFANLSPSEDDQYFAIGLHQEILNQLVKVSDLTVISRTTMMRYADGSKTPREIARDLDVETVLEGSVRRAGDTVRVAVQLVDPSTDTNLWSAFTMATWRWRYEPPPAGPRFERTTPGFCGCRCSKMSDARPASSA